MLEALGEASLVSLLPDLPSPSKAVSGDPGTSVILDFARACDLPVLVWARYGG